MVAGVLAVTAALTAADVERDVDAPSSPLPLTTGLTGTAAMLVLTAPMTEQKDTSALLHTRTLKDESGRL